MPYLMALSGRLGKCGIRAGIGTSKHPVCLSTTPASLRPLAFRPTASAHSTARLGGPPNNPWERKQARRSLYAHTQPHRHHTQPHVVAPSSASCTPAAERPRQPLAIMAPRQDLPGPHPSTTNTRNHAASSWPHSETRRRTSITRVDAVTVRALDGLVTTADLRKDETNVTVKRVSDRGGMHVAWLTKPAFPAHRTRPVDPEPRRSTPGFI